MSLIWGKHRGRPEPWYAEFVKLGFWSPSQRSIYTRARLKDGTVVVFDEPVRRAKSRSFSI